jgi:glutamine amidotransferase/cyclase
MITLLDYGAGNVRSVVNAIEKLGETVRVAASDRDIVNAEKLVFPGVGSFGSMMTILHEKRFVEPLLTFLDSGRPFLGICIGMQALFEGSEESPGVKGLGVLPGRRSALQLDGTPAGRAWLLAYMGGVMILDLCGAKISGQI